MTAVASVAESRRAAPLRPSVNGAAQPKRRWSLLVGGLLLVLFCAGIFAVVQLAGEARVQVLAVARPVTAGQVITAEDLRTARVVPDDGVTLVPAGQAEQVIGRSAAVPLAAGTLLAQSQLGPASWPDSGTAVVASPFKAGRVPAGVVPGSHALVVTVAKDDGSDASGPAAAPVPAMVVDVEAGVDGSGTTVVSLLLARDDATKLAGAGSELSLVLVAG